MRPHRSCVHGAKHPDIAQASVNNCEPYSLSYLPLLPTPLRSIHSADMNSNVVTGRPIRNIARHYAAAQTDVFGKKDILFTSATVSVSLEYTDMSRQVFAQK